MYVFLFIFNLVSVRMFVFMYVCVDVARICGVFKQTKYTTTTTTKLGNIIFVAESKIAICKGFS